MRIITILLALIVIGIGGLYYKIVTYDPKAKPTVNELLADKEKFSGKLLTIEGYLALDHVSQEILLFHDHQSSQTLGTEAGVPILLSKAVLNKCVDSRVLVRGEFYQIPHRGIFALHKLSHLSMIKKGQVNYRSDSLCVPVIDEKAMYDVEDAE